MEERMGESNEALVALGVGERTGGMSILREESADSTGSTAAGVLPTLLKESESEAVGFGGENPVFDVTAVW